MECNWNKTWTPVDELDPCVWVQCLHPPQVGNNKISSKRKYCFPLQPPEETQLQLEWDSAPVEFYSNVSYACASEDTYLDFDREAAEWNLTCLEGGGWQSPQPWPRCVNSKKTTIYISCFWSCLQVLEGAHLVVQCTI